MKFDAIIIGAGAAGLFCAMEAGRRGRKVLVLEHNAQVGRTDFFSQPFGAYQNFHDISVLARNFLILVQCKIRRFCNLAKPFQKLLGTGAQRAFILVVHPLPILVRHRHSRVTTKLRLIACDKVPIE